MTTATATSTISSTQAAAPLLLRASAIPGRYGVSRSWLWARVADGSLPRPRKLGPRVSVWPVAELDAAMARLLTTGADREVAA